MKHKHYDLIVKYYADMSQKVWCQANCSGQYEELPNNETITFYEFNDYHIGDQPPKRRVTIAGIEFDAPETKALDHGIKYWIPFGEGDDVFACEWSVHTKIVDNMWLRSGFIHLSRENAVLHAQALIALNKELVKASQ